MGHLHPDGHGLPGDQGEVFPSSLEINSSDTPDSLYVLEASRGLRLMRKVVTRQVSGNEEGLDRLLAPSGTMVAVSIKARAYRASQSDRRRDSWLRRSPNNFSGTSAPAGSKPVACPLWSAPVLAGRASPKTLWLRP